VFAGGSEYFSVVCYIEYVAGGDGAVQTTLLSSLFGRCIKAILRYLKQHSGSAA